MESIPLLGSQAARAEAYDNLTQEERDMLEAQAKEAQELEAIMQVGATFLCAFLSAFCACVGVGLWVGASRWRCGCVRELKLANKAALY